MRFPTVTGARLEALAQVEASLGAERNARMRRIGLGMLYEMSARCGWTQEMRQRLFAIGRTRMPVSDAADLITYPDEFAE